MRNGTTVEITNTDAEGRLILADALAEADGERPALLLDAATLTGAARVAVGPELPALFTPTTRWPTISPRHGREQSRPAVAPAAARALSQLHEEPGGRPRQCQQQAVRRRRSPRPCSSRSSSSRPGPGRISTCSPGTTTTGPAARAAARPSALRPLLALIEARFGAGQRLNRRVAHCRRSSARGLPALPARSRPAGWTTTSTGT